VQVVCVWSSGAVPCAEFGAVVQQQMLKGITGGMASRHHAARKSTRATPSGARAASQNSSENMLENGGCVRVSAGSRRRRTMAQNSAQTQRAGDGISASALQCQNSLPAQRRRLLRASAHAIQHVPQMACARL